MRKLSKGSKIVLGFTATALAVCIDSVNAQVETPEHLRTHHKPTTVIVKDYYLAPANGSVLRYSDISIAVRATYPGARPRITKRKHSLYPDCYDVKFLYKDELKRVSFNCTGTTIKLGAMKILKLGSSYV